MCVVAERLHQRLDIFMDEGVMRNVVGPRRRLLLVRHLAKKDQVRHFQEVGSLGQLFDRIAAVFENSLVAVYERNCTFGGRGVHQRRVVGHQTEVVFVRFDLTQIHRTHSPFLDRQLVRFARAIVGNC
jgi:hypothetical protein